MDSHKSTDDIAFFAADLGRTEVLAVSAAGAQRADANGPLVPGRYLLQILDLSVPTAKVWVRTGKFEKTKVIPIAAAPPAFPMTAAVVSAIEFIVEDKGTDNIAAQTSSGTANLYITRVSRGV